MATLARRSSAASLGIVRLDYDYPPSVGDIDHPLSFGYDVFYRVVPGLTFEMCQSGIMTPQVQLEFIAAINYLQDRGVAGITGDCGFMMYFQDLARRITKLPVFMSALAQLPAVTCTFASSELIAIFTANSRTLEPMRQLIRDECGVDLDAKRFIIVGCEDVPGFEAVALGQKVDIHRVMPGMVAKARQVLARYPQIRAILMECTELPPYSDALRAATGLPVYDAITACNFFMSGRLDEQRFGINDWQEMWDGRQEQYSFGQHLNATQRAALVNGRVSNELAAGPLPHAKLILRQQDEPRPGSMLSCSSMESLRQQVRANAFDIERLQEAVANLRFGKRRQA